MIAVRLQPTSELAPNANAVTSQHHATLAALNLQYVSVRMVCQCWACLKCCRAGKNLVLPCIALHTEK